jgi:branched-chain amino acid transport system permease protein
MSTFVQVVVTGVLLGGLYGLFSSGLTLVFGITRVVNFAHGEFVTLGMYAAIVFSTSAKASALYMLAPVAIVMILVGFGLHRIVLQRTIARAGLNAQDAQSSQMVLTLAISIVIANALLMVYGPAPKSAYPTLSGQYKVAGILFNHARLVAFLISLVTFVLLYLLLNRTRFGKAVRATVDDGDMATMVGIGTRAIYTITFGIGIMLAGITGVVLATFYPVTPSAGESFLIIAFVTVVLGGLGSVPGAFLAGLIVGVIQELTATYVALDLQNAGIFVLFLLVLLLRPQGLLARKALV